MYTYTKVHNLSIGCQGDERDFLGDNRQPHGPLSATHIRRTPRHNDHRRFPGHFPGNHSKNVVATIWREIRYETESDSNSRRVFVLTAADDRPTLSPRYLVEKGTESARAQPPVSLLHYPTTDQTAAVNRRCAPTSPPPARLTTGRPAPHRAFLGDNGDRAGTGFGDGA